MHPPNLGGNGGVSYSLNIDYLAWGEGRWSGFVPYFPPLKPRCALWSSASYSLKKPVGIDMANA